ncbi:hypothetical protein J7K91_01145 [bacterium]|nr:hypothetical protein [bacterium]
MPFFTLNQILVLLINLLAIIIAFLVLKHSPHKKIKKIFLFMTFLMLFWVDFAYFPRLLGKEFPFLALFFLKIAWLVTPLFFTSLYFLAIFLLEKERKYKNLTKLVIFFGLLSTFLTGFTDLVVADIKFAGPYLAIEYGPAMLPFLAMISFLIFATLFPLFREYFQASRILKSKLKYFIIGLFGFYLANVIFNIIFPLVFKIVHLYWIGDYSTFFLLGFTAYAIVRKELFEVKVILTEFLVALIAILLLIDFFISKTSFEYFWKGILFFTFLIFGNFLIKSVLREIKLRKQLEIAYQKLKKLDEAKTEFVSITSHQLRGPLGLIKGYLWMILNQKYGPFPEKLSRPLKNTFEATQRLVKVVNDLLNLSRIELGKISLEKRYFQIEEILDNIYKELLPAAQKKKLEFKIEKPKKPLPKIFGDPLKIREAIFNLVDNAIKYTQEGFVKISLEGKDNFVLIKIADSGIGFDPQELKDLFEKFRRAGRGKLIETQGTGLGLYIAKKFIELHKGRLWAESPGKGKGSTFYIRLPFNG